MIFEDDGTWNLSHRAIDLVTGYALDIPLGRQELPIFWESNPEIVAHIRKAREEMGIVIEDDMLVVDVPVQREPKQPHKPRPPRNRKPTRTERKANGIVRKLESKDMVKTPAGSRRWNLPIGAHIPGTDYTDEERGNSAKTPKTNKPKRPGTVKKPAETPAPRLTGGAGKTTTDKPQTIRTAHPKGSSLARAQEMLRAWGNAPQTQEELDNSVRRKNVKRSEPYAIEYGSKKELEDARSTAIDRAKNKTPKPSKPDIADNKRIIKEGGPGTQGTGANDNDNLRGNNAARAMNSWAVYVAFGGVDPKTGKDRGYVLCVGCGVKMTWHDNPNFSNYPKFEQDKIITTGDGGQYNPQNLVPMCSFCNNQRGNKKLWDSPQFKDSKPKWYTAAYQSEVARTRAAKRKMRKDKNGKDTTTPLPGYGRPKKEVAIWPMPVLPKREAPPRGIKSFEMKGFTMTDPMAADGDMVRAKQYNFDGRYPKNELPENAEQEIIGVYRVEEVDSAWGTYTRHSVVNEKGLIRFVEPETVQVVGKAAIEEKAALRAMQLEQKLSANAERDSTPGFRDPDLTKYWCEGAGLARWASTGTPYRSLVSALRAEGVPEKMVNGLAARYYKKVKGTWPGKRGGK